MKVAEKHMFFHFIKFYCIFSGSNLDLFHNIRDKDDILHLQEPQSWRRFLQFLRVIPDQALFSISPYPTC